MINSFDQSSQIKVLIEHARRIMKLLQHCFVHLFVLEEVVYQIEQSFYSIVFLFVLKSLHNRLFQFLSMLRG